MPRLTRSISRTKLGLFILGGLKEFFSQVAKLQPNLFKRDPPRGRSVITTSERV
jgi:hypothetical protein